MKIKHLKKFGNKTKLILCTDNWIKDFIYKINTIYNILIVLRWKMIPFDIKKVHNDNKNSCYVLNLSFYSFAIFQK